APPVPPQPPPVKLEIKDGIDRSEPPRNSDGDNKQTSPAKAPSPVPPSPEDKDTDDTDDDDVEISTLGRSYQFGINESSEQISAQILNDAQDDRSDAVRDLVWRLIYERKFGIAYHLVLALQSHYPNQQPKIPAWLVQAAALGPCVANPDGELSKVLIGASRQFDENCFAAGDKNWNQATRLLLLAASMQPAVIVPSSNASTILQQLRIKGLNQLG